MKSCLASPNRWSLLGWATAFVVLAAWLVSDLAVQRFNRAKGLHAHSTRIQTLEAPQIPAHPAVESPSDAILRLARSAPPGDARFLSALESLAKDPDQAAALTLRLMADCPERSEEIGTVVIGALVRGAAYNKALELAAAAGPQENRSEWIILVLRNWTQNRPEDAELITDLLREQNASSEAFDLVARSWATSAPAQLGRYLLALPAGDYRATALNAVVEPWILQDPGAVARWLPQLGDTAERDTVVSRLVARTDTVLRTTEQALGWAETIQSPELRREALASVLREWNAQDPFGAQRYLNSSPLFSVAQKQELVASFSTRPEAP
ncbi:MAG: hypothetical protein QM790_15440 [Nibricoccus sp.]